MDFSYSLPHPSFTIRGLSSLNTRPFLAVHRNRYDEVPRLFPSQLQADQLVEPRGEHCENRDTYSASVRKRKKLFHNHVYNKAVSPEAPLNDLESEILGSNSIDEHDREIRRLETESATLSNEAWRVSRTEVVPPPCLSTPGLFQAMAVTENVTSSKFRSSLSGTNGWDGHTLGYVNPLTGIGGDAQTALAFSPTGLLSSLTVAEINVEEKGDGTPIHVFGNVATVEQVPDFLLSDSGVIYDLLSSRSTSSNSGPQMLLATTVNGVSLAKIDKYKVQWRDQFPLQRVASTCFNPILAEEFSVLCEDGLFTGTAERLHGCLAGEMKYEHFIDLQPVSLATNLRFRQIHYGTHPRTVLFANSHGIRRFDWRTHDAKNPGDVVFDLEEHMSLSKRGVTLGPFQPLARSGGFQMLLATSIALLYIDVRMPHAPLLDWSLSLPSVVDYMSVCEVSQSEMSYDVIALCSQKHSYLEVFHAVHERQGEPFSFATSECTESWRPQSPSCEVLWSDMPLSHLQKLDKTASNTGLTLVQPNKKGHVSVVQWSPRDGLKAQLLSAGMFSEGQRDFEKHHAKLTQYSDSSVSIWKHHKALVDVGEHTTPNLVNNLPVRNLPGSVLHRRTRQMFWTDAVDLRERICRDDDDDVGHGRSATRLPRPYLGDIAFISRSREQLEVKSLGQERRSDVAAEDIVIERGHDSDIATQSHYSSEGDAGQIGDFSDVFIGGCTLSELARCTRSGLAHCRTPLGATGLEESLEHSSFVASTATEWHSTCLELHDDSHSQVDSNEKIPDWVNLRVYFAKGSDEHVSDRTGQIPETSDYGLLLRRMHSFFFD
ncbi:TATA box-binding protein-associated factor RNA polymerase I subunit C [Gracilaria domingensis]|nr:TATA box-binding protein-associated factor RNA polymerase I subunit C [Gracilaria domingensis]